MRIAVAMSGGVDSSVAAAVLVEQGHDVIGLSMQLYDQSGGERTFGSCCTLDDLHDARRVAAAINIPHYILNLERQFDEQVVSNFVREYAAGRTPLPCAHCNSDLKFATLVDRARGFGADFVATGHYARVTRDETTGRFLLAARRRPVEGSVVFPVLADAGAAGARRLSGRRSAEGRGSRVRAPPRSVGRRQARQPRNLLRAGQRLRGLREEADAGRGASRRRRRRAAAGCWPTMAAFMASPSASARASASPPRRRARRCTCWRSGPPISR